MSATATHLVLNASTTNPTAGSGDSLTITAKDSSDSTVTAYAGSKELTFGGASAIGENEPTVTSSSGTAVAFGSKTSITFTNGVATVSGSNNGVMTLYKAETASITVTDGTISNGGGLSVTVKPAAAASFTVPTPTAQSAGSAFEETLTALDAYGNTATGYAGEKTIAFSGPSNSPNATAPKYPASVSFSAGVGNTSITLYKAESTALTAKDGSISGSSGSFAVGPNSSAKLAFTQQPSGSTGGVAFATQPKVAVQDAFGNTVTSDSSSVTLSITTPEGATLTCTSNPLAASSGVASFAGCKIDK
ncbi:MAG TPA: hypothetical protein VLJ80_05610, partial [Solirubrobacteraceae bacterium]|nr:hypothetical protein [Solirubrobacteraceae bacterium]